MSSSNPQVSGSAKPAGRPVFAWGAGLLIAAALAASVAWVVQRDRTSGAPVVTLGALKKENGKLILSATGQPFRGWVEDRYANQVLKSRSWVDDGVLNGVSEGWYSSGSLQIREHFRRGASEGVVTRYHTNGAVQSEATARAGKLDGLMHRWHENGVLAEEVTFVAGQPHGISRSWFPSGSLKAEVNLDAGRVVGRKYWKDGEHPGDKALAMSTTAR